MEPSGAATGARRDGNWGPAGLQPADEINIPKLSHLQKEFIKQVFVNFISICNTDKNEYTPKLKGTNKCNLRFADFGVSTSSFSVIITI